MEMMLKLLRPPRAVLMAAEADEAAEEAAAEAEAAKKAADDAVEEAEKEAARAAEAVAQAQEAAALEEVATAEFESTKKPGTQEGDLDHLIEIELNEKDHDSETLKLQQDLKKQREEHNKQIAEAERLRLELQTVKSEFDAAVVDKHDTMKQADSAWDKYKLLKKVHRSKVLSLTRFKRGTKKPDPSFNDMKELPNINNQLVINEEDDDGGITGTKLKAAVKKTIEASHRRGSMSFEMSRSMGSTFEPPSRRASGELDFSFSRHSSQNSALDYGDGAVSSIDENGSAMTTVDLEPLMKRLEDLENGGNARKTQMDTLDKALHAISSSAAEVVAQGSGRDGKLRELNAKLKALSSAKVSRRDYDGLHRRVNGIEEVMFREKQGGLSMPEIADRLEILEKTTAELRVRTVLEEQVQKLAETKGDAAVFTAQLNELSFALRRLVDEVRQDDRNAVDVAIRTIASRQDESSESLENFTKDIKKNMHQIQSRLDEVTKEATVPRILKMLKDQTISTVDTALQKQDEVLAKHGRGLQGAKEDVARLPNEASIRRLVGVCMESAISAKDREIRRLQHQVETMREQSARALRREEAIDLVTKRVDNILSSQFGETVTAHSEGDHRKVSKKGSGVKLLLGAMKTAEDSRIGGSRSGHDPVMSIEGKDTPLLSSSLPSLSSSSRGGGGGGGGGSNSIDEKSYLTNGLSSNGRTGPNNAGQPSSHQPNRWRPIHRKKAHEHMKTKGNMMHDAHGVHGVSSLALSNHQNHHQNNMILAVPTGDSGPWSAPHQQDGQLEGYHVSTNSSNPNNNNNNGFSYGNGREAALRPLGVMMSDGLPSSPLQTMTVNAKNITSSKGDKRQQSSLSSHSQLSQEFSQTT